MTVLTNFGVFNIITLAAVTEEVEVVVLPLSSDAAGTGQLVHPTLGTLDYPYAPDEWTNIDTDVVVPPVWGGQPTLGGFTNTLHPGFLRDVVVSERWTSELSMPIEFLRALCNFWVNPPAPENGYLLWYPSYTTTLGYKVIIYSVTVNGKEISLNYVSRQGWVNGTIELTMRIAGRE